MRQGWIRSAVAVLVGNLIYFRILTPLLPPAAHHAPWQWDLGLLLDAWVCLVVYGVVELVRRVRGARR